MSYISKLILLFLAMIFLAIISLGVGQVTLSVSESIEGLFSPQVNSISIIVQELRLPRALLGLMVGAALGVSGAALQGVLRNPLADPGIIGVSASSALGAVLAIHMGLVATTAFALPIFAMTGAIIATFIIMFLASRDSSILMIILVGIGISSLATACVSLVMNMADSPMTLRDMVMWLMGSLENRTFDDLWLASPLILLGWLIMLGSSSGLSALSVGEEVAQTMGINVKALKLRVVLGSAISVGASVAVCGSIGFVGLIVPHIARGTVSRDPGKLLLPSAIIGAILLTLADILTRLPSDGTTLRLGVVTALIGAPAFLYIIYKTRESMR